MINYHDVRYKRTLCKNWQTSKILFKYYILQYSFLAGTCIIGIKCHFAHGQEEIRNPTLDVKYSFFYKQN